MTDFDFDQLLVASIGIYLPMLILIPKFNPRYNLSMIFFVHNVFLTFGSGVLLFLMLLTLFPIIKEKGVMYSFCHETVFQDLEKYFIINYIFKYYELLDTIFLLLKGKKVAFLHWFHHAMTLVVCHYQIWGRTTVSWIPIVINLSVHVLMYAYYAMQSISSREVWWKKYLTSLQITQFIIDIIVIIFCMAVAVNFRYLGPNTKLGRDVMDLLGIKNWWYPTWGMFGVRTEFERENEFVNTGCAGDMRAAIIGLSVLLFYLFLFVRFYISNYTNKKERRRRENAKIKRTKKFD
jgi:fatty acid elongase 3